MSLKRIIEDVGLSKNETNVYLATLELGEGTVQQISQKAGAPRTSIYQILASLQKKSLVSQYQRKGVLRFSAVNPRYFFQQLKNRMEAFETAIPELDALTWQASERPRVRFFEGKDGVITAFEEMLVESKRSKMIYTIGLSEIYKSFPRYFPSFVERRVRYKIRQKTIVIDDVDGRKYKQENISGALLRQVKLIPPTYSYATDETVTGNKIFAFSYKKQEVYAVIIDSKDMADTKKRWFEFIWDHLPD